MELCIRCSLEVGLFVCLFVHRLIYRPWRRQERREKERDKANDFPLGALCCCQRQRGDAWHHGCVVAGQDWWLRGLEWATQASVHQCHSSSRVMLLESLLAPKGLFSCRSFQTSTHSRVQISTQKLYLHLIYILYI